MKYYLQKEAAEKLKLSRYTLADLEESGRIPKAKRFANNGYRYYFAEDLIQIAKIYYGADYQKIIGTPIEE